MINRIGVSKDHIIVGAGPGVCPDLGGHMGPPLLVRPESQPTHGRPLQFDARIVYLKSHSYYSTHNTFRSDKPEILALGRYREQKSDFSVHSP